MLDPKIVLLGDSLKPFRLAKHMLKALKAHRVTSRRRRTSLDDVTAPKGAVYHDSAENERAARMDACTALGISSVEETILNQARISLGSIEISTDTAHQTTSLSQDTSHIESTTSSTGATVQPNPSRKQRKTHKTDETTAFEEGETTLGTGKGQLMSLPREIRDLIYKHALCPGKAFSHAKPFKSGRPYTDPWNGLAEGECEHPRPSLALLATCGRIHDEALSVYLSKNNFVIAKGDVGETMDFILNIPEEKRVHIQDVTLCFHPSDLSTLSRAGVRADIDLYFQQRGGVTNYTLLERREIIHFFESIELEKIWREKYTALSHSNHIKEITFDAECPIRCCTPGEIALPTMQRIGCYGPNLPKKWHLKVLQDYDAIKKEILGRDFHLEDQ